LPTRVKTLVWGKDNVGEFLWKTTSRTLRYAANRIPEIADTIVEIDNAIKWGFGWEIGVFETWDAIGVRESVERMRAEGSTDSGKRRKNARKRRETFTKRKRQNLFLILSTAATNRIPEQQGVIVLKSVKDRTGVIKKNAGASLLTSATAWRVWNFTRK
jgi:3-hydroxyacyl-CoA dehydrogenase